MRWNYPKIKQFDAIACKSDVKLLTEKFHFESNNEQYSIRQSRKKFTKTRCLEFSSLSTLLFRLENRETDDPPLAAMPLQFLRKKNVAKNRLSTSILLCVYVIWKHVSGYRPVAFVFLFHSAYFVNDDWLHIVVKEDDKKTTDLYRIAWRCS